MTSLSFILPHYIFFSFFFRIEAKTKTTSIHPAAGGLQNNSLICHNAKLLHIFIVAITATVVRMVDKIVASLKGGLGTHFPVKDSPEKKERKSEPDATTVPLAFLLFFLMIIRVVQW